MLGEVNGLHRNVAPSIGPQGLVLYFASDRPASGDARGGLDIWRAERDDRSSLFRSPKRVAGLNSACDDLPRLSADGKMLVVLRACGRGAVEILRSTKGADGGWGPLLPLDPWLHDALGVSDLWVSAGARTLVVSGSSKRDGQQGLFRLEWGPEGRYGEPKLLLQRADFQLRHPWARITERRIELVFAERYRSATYGGDQRWRLRGEVIQSSP